MDYSLTIRDDALNRYLKLGRFRADAYLVADHINVKALGLTGRNLTLPLILTLKDDSIVFAYRYGALVFFQSDPLVREAFLAAIADKLEGAYEQPEHESLDVILSPQSEGMVGAELMISTVTSGRLECIADTMAKSVKLDRHEDTIADRFEKVKPIAHNIIKGRIKHGGDKGLLRYIGWNLLVEQELVGRVEMEERPTMLWEQAELDPLYNELLEEFEVSERLSILDKKMELITRTAQTYLDVSAHQHEARLEWYIIILIGIEIVLQLYSMFIGGVPH